jgi:hypothetical protein
MQVFKDDKKKNIKTDKTVKWFKNEILEIKRYMRQQVVLTDGKTYTQKDSLMMKQINQLNQQMKEYIQQHYPEVAHLY